MSDSKHAKTILAYLPQAVLLTVVALLLWMAWCMFPGSGWNFTRLAPAHMLAHGVNPYPPLGEGPLTTWTYGPVPLLWLWPATWMPTLETSLGVAGLLNLTSAILPVVLFAFLHRPLRPGSTSLRGWVIGIALALWPASALMFIQADNYAVAFGLASLIALAETAFPPSAARGWIAALLCAAAAWCKQTETALALSHVLFVFARHGGKAAAVHTLRLALCGLCLFAIFGLWIGWAGLWTNTVTLPRMFPHTPLLAKLTSSHHLPHVFIGLVLPLAGLLVFRRQIFRSSSPFLAYALAFLCTLPLNLAGLASYGGSTNSLHGHLYLLPALAGVVAIRACGRPQNAWLALTGGLAGAALVTVPLHIYITDSLSFRPRFDVAKQSLSLARSAPGEVYFPWLPLVSFYAEGRFYHSEDGINVRTLCGLPLRYDEALAHFPPHMHFVVFHHYINEGMLSKVIPAAARRHRLGEWIVVEWDPRSGVAP